MWRTVSTAGSSWAWRPSCRDLDARQPLIPNDTLCRLSKYSHVSQGFSYGSEIIIVVHIVHTMRWYTWWIPRIHTMPHMMYAGASM